MQSSALKVLIVKAEAHHAPISLLKHYLINLVVDETESSLFFILDPNLQEQTHARITESRYSQLLISTITHDLKSPITAIKGNLDILEHYITIEGKDFLLAAQISTKIFEYYIYDLIVFFHDYYRIIA